MGFTWWQFLLIAVVVMLFFGRGKISDIMGDVAHGIKSFKKGMSDEEEETKAEESVKSIAADGETAASEASAKEKAS